MTSPMMDEECRQETNTPCRHSLSVEFAELKGKWRGERNRVAGERKEDREGSETESCLLRENGRKEGMKREGE